MPKDDLLHLCNNMGVAIPDFEAAFCSRCMQSECQRSLAGKSLFEARVHTWEDRLFKNPPKMDPSDPRFARISAQEFPDIQPSPYFIPNIGESPRQQSDWVDLRDLQAHQVEKKPEPKKAPPPPTQKSPESEPEVAEKELQNPEHEPVDSEPEVAQAKPKSPMPTARRLQTSFQQGTMLEGATAPQPKAPKDPWAAPVATEDGAPVVKPGAKIRFGR